MEIEPHPESSKKALVTLEDLQEGLFLTQAIPPHRATIDFYKPYVGILAAQINLLGNRQPEPITFSHRQLRWVSKRMAPWESPRIRWEGPEDLAKLHKMSQTVLDYLGVRLAKGG